MRAEAAVHVLKFLDGFPQCERGSDDRPGAGAGDVVEVVGEDEAFLAVVTPKARLDRPEDLEADGTPDAAAVEREQLLWTIGSLSCLVRASRWVDDADVRVQVSVAETPHEVAGTSGSVAFLAVPHDHGVRRVVDSARRLDDPLVRPREHAVVGGRLVKHPHLRALAEDVEALGPVALG